VHDPHPFTATAGGGLDHNRKPGLVGGFAEHFDIGRTGGHAGNKRDTGLCHSNTRSDLVAHQFHRFGSRTYEHDPLSLAAAGKIRVFGKEAVAGVYSISAGFLGGGNDLVDAQV